VVPKPDTARDSPHMICVFRSTTILPCMARTECISGKFEVPASNWVLSRTAGVTKTPGAGTTQRRATTGKP